MSNLPISNPEDPMLHIQPFVRRIVIAAACLTAIAVVAAATVASSLGSVTVASYAVPLQGAASGTVTLNAATPSTIVVALSSSNPQVVGVPSGVPIQPGANRGVFVATGVGPGCATVTAKLGTDTRVRSVIVHPASSATTFTMTVPNQFLALGTTAPASVSNGTGSGIAQVTLSSSNPAVVTVPPNVKLMRGAASFGITTQAEGCAVITATFGSQIVKRTVQVVYISG